MFVVPQSGTVTRAKAMLRSVSLPLGGWDAKSPFTDMPKENAVVMDNVFPDASKLKSRGGYQEYSTGMTGNVETLFVYRPDSGTSKMFAANDGKIYDVTSGGAVGAAVKSGLNGNQWQYVNMGTSGGRFLFACNGEDTAQTYNGTTWANTTLTGPTTSALVWCNLHQRRLWTGQSGSLSAWYGGTDAIAGAFTEFPLYAVANLGGYIMGMATWTRDAGDGQDDVAVFVTSEGQAIVYSGTDPSSDATWSLIGVFRIGKPIGRRFFVKAGGDLVLITEDGFVSLATILALDRAQSEKAAISAQINPKVNEVVQSSGGNFGWQPIIYPRGKMLIFNVPIDGDNSHQYVFNTITRAPCRFTGMNANCWEVMDDNLFFGGKDGKVYQADTGTKDNGSNINCVVVPSFNALGTANIKQACLAGIIFESEDDVSFAFRLFKNYHVPDFIDAASTTITGTSSLWDSAVWDASLWGGRTARSYWRGVSGLGHAFSLGCAFKPANAGIDIIDMRVTYKTGGFLR